MGVDKTLRTNDIDIWPIVCIYLYLWARRPSYRGKGKRLYVLIFWGGWRVQLCGSYKLFLSLKDRCEDIKGSLKWVSRNHSMKGAGVRFPKVQPRRRLVQHQASLSFSS